MGKIVSYLAVTLGILLMFLSVIAIIVKMETGEKPEIMMNLMSTVLVSGGLLAIVKVVKYGMD